MGTELQTIQLQDEIRQIIGQLGMTHNQAAKYIYTEIHDFDDDEEIGRFQESFKKKLQRKTTKPECLQDYLVTLKNHYETRNGNKKKPSAVKPKKLSAFIAKEMSRLSEDLDLTYEK
jgi:hypothetical protein